MSVNVPSLTYVPLMMIVSTVVGSVLFEYSSVCVLDANGSGVLKKHSSVSGSPEGHNRYLERREREPC